MALASSMKDDAWGACHMDNGNKQTLSFISLVSTNRRGPLGLFRQTDEQQRCRGNNGVDRCRNVSWWRREPSGKYCGQTLLEVDHIRSSLRALPTVDEYKEQLRTPCSKNYGKAETPSVSQTRSAWMETSSETISGCQVARVVDTLLKKKTDLVPFNNDELVVHYGRHTSRISNRHNKNM